MCENVQEQIQQAAAKAKNLLGQLGPLVWALHSTRGAVVPAALCVEFEPEEYVAIGADESPEDRKKRKDEVVEVLRNLKKGREGEHPGLFTSAAYRATINRSIVVYAVAVLEGFLDEASKPVWKHLRSDRTQNWPPDALDKIALLDRLDEHGSRVSNAKHYEEAGWLVLVRNAIIHADGKASSKTRDDAREHGLSPRWRYVSGNLEWDSCATQQLTGEHWNRVPFSIAIDHFILPRLRDAQEFVGEGACILQKLAQVGQGSVRPVQGGDCEQ
jgi:hypothetical protein